MMKVSKFSVDRWIWTGDNPMLEITIDYKYFEEKMMAWVERYKDKFKDRETFREMFWLEFKSS